MITSDTHSKAYPYPPITERVRNIATISSVPLPLFLLIISFIIPEEISFYLGSVRLIPLRVIILIYFIPAVFKYLSDPTIKVQTFDVFLVLFSIWFSLGHLLNHPLPESFELAGSNLLECLGAYLLVRAYLRTAEQFLGVIKLLFWCVAAIVLLAIPEALTGQHLAHDIAVAITGEDFGIHKEERLGFTRASATLSHPILVGTFCASLFSFVWYLNSSRQSKFIKTSVIFAGVFASLSSAPFLMFFGQMVLMIWEKITRQFPARLQLTLIGFAIVYLIIELISHRPAIVAITTQIALNPWNAYVRSLIWDYGIQNVWMYPFLGNGINEWIRPFWLPISVDNFWLVLTMRSGIPSIVFLLIAIISLYRSLLKAPAPKENKDYKTMSTAWCIGFLALCVCGGTVHYFGTSFPYFFFILALPVWLIEINKETPHTAEV